MKYLLIILVLLTKIAIGQTISPLPVAGSQTVVTINTKTYMVAYPSGIPAGADVRVMLSWNGIGEITGDECDDNGWHRTIKNGWNMKQRKADGSYIWWIVIGIPYYGTSSAVVNSYYSQPIDALCNYFVAQGLLDSTNVDNFNSMGLSIGSRSWYYFGNFGPHNGVYHKKFKRVLTQSPVNISNAWVNPNSTTGRYAVFFNTLDPNNEDDETPPKYAYNNYNYTASTNKRIDSVSIASCHCNTMWDSAISVSNFASIPSPTGRNANNNLMTWLTDPTAGIVANVPPNVNAGVDQTKTLPTNTATLAATASDPDGTIATYAWTKVSGPTGGSITTPTTGTTTITGLTAGTYVYRITVTDNSGATASDDINIIVNGSGDIIVTGRRPILL
jgi:hypothetical protein